MDHDSGEWVMKLRLRRMRGLRRSLRVASTVDAVLLSHPDIFTSVLFLDSLLRFMQLSRCANYYLRFSSDSSVFFQGCFYRRCGFVFSPGYLHLGALPYAMKQLGLSAPVYATEPVHRLGLLTMYDQYLSRKIYYSDTISKHLEIGGNVLLPVDTAGRVLELLLILEQHWSQRAFSFPIYFLTYVSSSTFDYVKSYLEWMSTPFQSPLRLHVIMPLLRHVTLLINKTDLDPTWSKDVSARSFCTIASYKEPFKYSYAAAV
ncbi:hypothetical protein Bca52824_003611 [Brassica carinata]|uniref:Cleavage and polyadenylation specificity factor subunit 2 n=1 Tax=Brassica carinata TaxID=52824 RepID=A0A8X7WLG8_BRACI|nr:hypothetical protein Bca52824_003611 [Brassica carinata]